MTNAPPITPLRDQFPAAPRDGNQPRIRFTRARPRQRTGPKYLLPLHDSDRRTCARNDESPRLSGAGLRHREVNGARLEERGGAAICDGHTLRHTAPEGAELALVDVAAHV